MILRRIGNKTKIAKEIIKYFPKHKIYIELFFGAGGMYFNKPKAQYNYLNDIDSEIYNLFKILKENPDKLIDYIELMPVHTDLWREWKHQVETDKYWQAVRFLFYSNFGYLGKKDTLGISAENTKRQLIKSIKNEYKKINDGSIIMNYDFRVTLNKIKKGTKNFLKTFIYADPPYLKTKNNYSNKWTLQDSKDLFRVLTEQNIKFAISELDGNPEIEKLIKQYNLTKIKIKTRKTLKSRATEILILNYKDELELF